MPVGELTLQDVAAGYAGTTVLEGVSFSVRAGERVGIIGRNGAGKTTTLSAILGLAELRAGKIAADGVSIAGLRPFRRARLGIGYVPQTRDVFPTLTVEENLLAAVGSASRRRLDSAYELFPRLRERRNNKGRELSGGEQQMLSIARALMNDISVLLLDEPLEGLAPIVADQVMDAIRKLVAEQELACVLVEQHVDTVLDFCTRVLVLERGTAKFFGPVADLRERPELLESAIGLKKAAGPNASNSESA
jgi:branched-chain amino acid transport system ATP-binding protein